MEPKNYWTQSPDNIYVAAHRGFSEKYPENTMIAFEKALEVGVDQIETDVHLTKDGELVLMHDHSVDATTSGHGLIADLTFAEIRALDAGIKKGKEFAGTKVPTFGEFLELCKKYPDLTLDIELKEYPTPGREKLAYDTADRVIDILETGGFSGRYVTNTFSGKLHEYIRNQYGDKQKQHVYYPRHCLSDAKVDAYTYGYCVCMLGGCISPETYITATPDEYKAIRQTYGIRTWAGPAVKDAFGVDLAIRCGAELITCNNPEIILSLLRERGKHQ